MKLYLSSLLILWSAIIQGANGAGFPELPAETFQLIISDLIPVSILSLSQCDKFLNENLLSNLRHRYQVIDQDSNGSPVWRLSLYKIFTLWKETVNEQAASLLSIIRKHPQHYIFEPYLFKGQAFARKSMNTSFFSTRMMSTVYAFDSWLENNGKGMQPDVIKIIVDNAGGVEINESVRLQAISFKYPASLFKYLLDVSQDSPMIWEEELNRHKLDPNDLQNRQYAVEIALWCLRRARNIPEALDYILSNRKYLSDSMNCILEELPVNPVLQLSEDAAKNIFTWHQKPLIRLFCTKFTHISVLKQAIHYNAEHELLLEIFQRHFENWVKTPDLMQTIELAVEILQDEQQMMQFISRIKYHERTRISVNIARRFFTGKFGLTALVALIYRFPFTQLGGDFIKDIFHARLTGQIDWPFEQIALLAPYAVSANKITVDKFLALPHGLPDDTLLVFFGMCDNRVETLKELMRRRMCPSMLRYMLAINSYQAHALRSVKEELINLAVESGYEEDFITFLQSVLSDPINMLNFSS